VKEWKHSNLRWLFVDTSRFWVMASQIFLYGCSFDIEESEFTVFLINTAPTKLF